LCPLVGVVLDVEVVYVAFVPPLTRTQFTACGFKKLPCVGVVAVGVGTKQLAETEAPLSVKAEPSAAATVEVESVSRLDKIKLAAIIRVNVRRRAFCWRAVLSIEKTPDAVAA
jgi:hypothetical protein